RTGQLTIESRKVLALDGRDRDVTSKRIAITGRNGEPEYIMNVIEDVTARKRDEQELHRARNMLHAVIENIPEMLVVKEARSGRYILVNRAGEELLGAKSEDLIGKTTAEIFPRDQAEVIVARDQEALRTGELKVDFHPTCTLDGRLRDVSSKRVAIGGDNGEPEYLLTVIEDITERKRNETRIAHMAHHDPLTDLANRAALNMKLAETVQQAAAEDGHFALLCIDLDRFKEVNDLYGHAAGDNVLLELASRMKEAAAGTFLARLGGDEFMAICVDDADTRSAAARLAGRLVDAVSGDFDCDGRKVRLGMSIGVAMYPDDGTDVVGLLRNADAALYRAKAEGRGAIRFFEADMDRMLHDRRALQADLTLAVARNELQLFYQPQARVSGQIIGFEALLRWDHLRRGFVPPGTFIPLAEQSGLIDQIGEWVLREGCREAATWRKPLQIAINLSPVQLRQAELVPLVHSVLLETGLAPERLVLEITEGALMDDYSRAVSILRRLKALGVRIAMDDFGTGYSSLSYLQSFPFDKIKIDQTFIANLERNAQSAAIVRAVLGLGRSLDLTTVAEGVETQAQLTVLRSEGCDEMQGYLIGRPQPISEYAEIAGRPARDRRVAAAG
ncbi:MAG: putative bifunctional diguanylate cyclase/phosphodiesterase, partial [Pseudorhodoplanes sp.]